MSLKLTKVGKELLLRTIAGETALKFLEIQLGNGADAGENAFALSNPLVAMEITQYTANEDFLTLEAAYSNQNVDAAFSATELGVLAEDPDVAGSKLLYAYQFTPESSANRVWSSQDAVVETQLCVNVYVGDVEDVEVVLAQPGENVTRTEFENFTARRDNPHGVTADQVGLGNVPNAKPENMTVKMTEVPPNGDVVNLTSGERLGLSLGKIRRAITALLQHFNSKNPHKITAEEIDAAPAQHEHSTNEMTSGTLGIPRGGTGGKTAREARENLDIRSGQFHIEITAGKIMFAEFHFSKPYRTGEYPYIVLTPMLGAITDLQLGINMRSATGFTVMAYSPTYSGVVACNWIACL